MDLVIFTMAGGGLIVGFFVMAAWMALRMKGEERREFLDWLLPWR